MSDTWFNLRVLWFHIQCEHGRLFAFRVSQNGFWREDDKWHKNWWQLYECDLRRAFAKRDRLAKGQP